MSGSGDIGLLIGVFGLLFAWLALVVIVLQLVREILRSARQADTSDKGPGRQGGDGVRSRRIPPGGSHVALRPTVRMGLAISTVAVLVALVGFGVYWVLQHREISHLEDNNAQLKAQAADHKAVKEAVTARLASTELLPRSEQWEAEHEEYAIWFWVTDELTQPVPGCAVSAVRTGDQAVTQAGGMTGSLWVRLGDRMSIEKDGYQRQDIYLDLEKAKEQVIHVTLRRNDHVNKETSGFSMG